jgi:PAS domain S-box-containing protein
MTSIVQEDGLYAAEAEAVLASPPFAPLAASGAPLLLAAGAPPRIIAATEATLALFGAASPEALNARVFDSAEPGARRLAELARTLLPGAAPRLERLRFFFGPIAEQVTVLCQRIAGAHGPVFVAAMLGVRPNLLRPTTKPATPPALRVVEAAVGRAAPAPDEFPGGQIEARRAPAPPQGPLSFEAAREALRQRYPSMAPVRFLWRTDAEDRLVEISPPLAEVTGARVEDLIGETLQDAAVRLGLDPEGKLSAALSGRGTWSGLDVAWPLAGADAAVPATLGGSPGFDRARAFTGYRGFGVLHPARLAPQTRRTETAPADADALTPHAPADNDSSPVIAAVRPAPAAPPTQGDEAPPAPMHEAATMEPVLAPASPVEGARRIAPAVAAPQPLVPKAWAPRPEGFLDLTPRRLPPDHPHAAPIADGAASAPAVTDPLDAFGPEHEEAAPIMAGPPLHESDLAEPTTAAVESVADETRTGADPAPTGSAVAPPVVDAPAPPAMAAFHESDLVEVDDAADANGSAGNVAPTAARSSGIVVPLRPTSEPAPARPAEAAGSDAIEPAPAVTRPPKLPNAELTPSERNAFREIARTLGARLDEPKPESLTPAAAAAGSPATAPVPDAAQATVQPIVGGDARDLIAIAGRAAGAAEAPPLGPALAGVEGPARALLDRMPLGVLVSRGAAPIFANRGLLELLGYADVDEFHAMGGMERMFKGRLPDQLGQDAGGAIPLLTRAGEVIPAETHMQTLDWGGLPATLMTLRPTREADLLPQVRSLEMELRKAEADARELRAILDTATDGVAVLDPAGRILALNRSAEALFGYDQNEVAGEPFSVLIARDSHGAVADYLDGLKSNGVASVLNDGREVMGRARQGGAIPMFMTLGRIGAGEQAKFCAVLRDLSQWKKAERELNEARAQAERASALKSDFLAKISHEIRTPLNAILGFAEVIMEERFGPVGNERYKDYLKDIHASGTHVMSLVNDLLDLSKIEAGKMDLNFGSVDANRIVSECVSLIQPQAARERVIVRLSLAPRLPNIVADERSLRQIVLNLLSNAVKFNEPGGQVIVSSALTDAGHAVVRIRDTGIGMSDEDVATALEPFRQVATSRQTTGTGLGLPLTKALVEANRASFTIKSKKREGTLVEVAFPPTRVLAE